MLEKFPELKMKGNRADMKTAMEEREVKEKAATDFYFSSIAWNDKTLYKLEYNLRCYIG